ncbi:hypothetical protein HDU76_005285 [Blyttiomyces sp. JEL0837]|nr:hypothetical protein HDU76_005285 [Blyttiomyces sp. JEL0837]
MSKVIIVTGVSRGIGLAVVKTLLSLGSSVVGVARSPLLQQEQLLCVSKEYPSSFEYVQADVTEPSLPDRAVSIALSRFSRLDGVVFNAGVLEPIQKLANVDLDQFRKLLEINTVSTLALAQRALPHLRTSGGKMIFVSSGAATNAYDGWGPYCTSKAAMNMLVQTFGKEEPNVTSVSVRPGVVDTEMQVLIRKPENEQAMTAASHANFVGLHSGGKLLKPEQPGHVIAKLVLDAPKSLSGSFITWNDEKLAAFQLKE